LILLGRFAHHRIISDDGRVVVEGNDLRVIGGKFEQRGIAEFVDGFLLLVQRAIDPDQGEIVSEDAIEKGFVVFLLGPDKSFFARG